MTKPILPACLPALPALAFLHRSSLSSSHLLPTLPSPSSNFALATTLGDTGTTGGEDCAHDSHQLQAITSSLELLNRSASLLMGLKIQGTGSFLPAAPVEVEAAAAAGTQHYVGEAAVHMLRLARKARSASGSARQGDSSRSMAAVQLFTIAVEVHGKAVDKWIEETRGFPRKEDRGPHTALYDDPAATIAGLLNAVKLTMKLLADSDAGAGVAECCAGAMLKGLQQGGKLLRRAAAASSGFVKQQVLLICRYVESRPKAAEMACATLVEVSKEAAAVPAMAEDRELIIAGCIKLLRRFAASGSAADGFPPPKAACEYAQHAMQLLRHGSVFPVMGGGCEEAAAGSSPQTDSQPAAAVYEKYGEKMVAAVGAVLRAPHTPWWLQLRAVGTLGCFAQLRPGARSVAPGAG